MDLRKATAGALALLVGLALVIPAVPLPTTTPPDTSILQEAVNAYASIGQAASCATYLTYPPNGDPAIVNNSCRVGDSWVDANLSVEMTSNQLKAALTDAGSAPAGLFTSDPLSSQVTPTITTPTSTTHTPVSPQQVAESVDTTASDVNRGIEAASFGCSAAGAANSFFLGGIATEVTQLCNFAALASTYSVKVQHYKAFMTSLQGLSSRAPFATRGVALGNPSVVDIHGESSPIGRLVNGYGGDPAAAWAAGTVPMHADYLQSQAPGSPHLSSAASVNLVDSFGADAIRTAGDMRRQQASTLAAVTALQQQAAAVDPASNTPVAQANITNAALMQLINAQATSQSAEVAVLEQVTIANTWQRNAAATAANNYAHMLEVRRAKTADLSGLSSAVKYRMP